MLDRLLELSSNVAIDTLLLLPVLIALEAVLSADNAIALASIAQGLHDRKLEQRALNIGLVLAYILRILLIIGGSWALNFWQFELAGALYLLWLVFQYFTSEIETETKHHKPRFQSLWQVIPILALTDLAFSLDSVTTAIALSQETWLILLGGTIGMIALRFMAGLFIRWIEEFTHLETAGYLAVAFVGLRLLLRVINPAIVPSEWLMLSAIALVFLWGFSQREQDAKPEVFPSDENDAQAWNSHQEKTQSKTSIVMASNVQISDR